MSYTRGRFAQEKLGFRASAAKLFLHFMFRPLITNQHIAAAIQRRLNHPIYKRRATALIPEALADIRRGFRWWNPLTWWVDPDHTARQLIHFVKVAAFAAPYGMTPPELGDLL